MGLYVVELPLRYPAALLRGSSFCGVELAKVRGFNVFDGFQAVSAQLAYGMIDRDAYMMNLAMLYLFTIVGAVPTIMNIVRNTSFTNRVSQIGQRIG